MNEQVIEAAAKRYEGSAWDSYSPEVRAGLCLIMKAALYEADAARAPEIIAAVDAFARTVCRHHEAVMRSGDYGNLTKRQRDEWMSRRDQLHAEQQAARRELYALLGIEEGA